MQEDLAALFMRQMSMDGVHQTAISQPPTPSNLEPSQDASSIVYSITQHYHHSSHIANSTSSSAQQQPADPKPEIPPGVPAENVLMQYNIDPWRLFPSQLTLFKQAGPDQQSRLISLWQISPPGYSRQIGQGPNCQIRNPYSSERNGFIETGGDSMEEDAPANQQAEPYVLSGYESLAQRDYDMSTTRQAESQISSDQHLLVPPPVEPSTGSQYKLANDPAYQSREWWNHPGGQQEDPLEHQYGAFQQQTNGYGDRGIAQARGHWMEDEHMF